ncbi:MAG: URC4/urg3 family protein [Rhodobacteraceae bacterium]|nr:URC4/urg3 family protein [Paracoccaceae bacterium]
MTETSNNCDPEDLAEDLAAARALLTPEAIRTHCGELYASAERNELAHFTLHPERLGHAAEAVCETIAAAYPSLDIPPHARWRHFVFAGEDRGAALRALAPTDKAERARIEFELAITSVLLDAGAGPDWRYHDTQTGVFYSRSEGLALASLDLYQAGGFSSDPSAPLRADAAALSGFSAEALTAAFQVSPENPLEGAEGRAALIQRLGAAMAAHSALFPGARLGGLADTLAAMADTGALPARTILTTLLEALGPIWPNPRRLAGLPLGDVWPHPLASGAGLVPFHKLSQWLSYSLIEPLERRGLRIVDLDALTGLAEYRNGGLFLDTGVIALRNPGEADTPQNPGGELIVEWRALTVRLLDQVAEAVRAKLGKSAEQMPLASVLEGGTWATGRRLAAERRQGRPPIAIKSDGSVF